MPEEWTAQVDPGRWTPTTGQQEQPSIASGARPGWNSDTEPAPGVFVGILAGDKLPTRVPQHVSCETNDPMIEDQQDGDASMTVFFNGCPGADVSVERVVQLTSNRLLWVQVRSNDRATANQVLESVTTYGI